MRKWGGLGVEYRYRDALEARDFAEGVWLCIGRESSGKLHRFRDIVFSASIK